jgi:class 3 adenylate cyclase
MRIVDFNREWKQLSLCFPPRLATRLLAENDYVERFLSPREREVAVLFSDITGFTRLSEQVLRAPVEIGRLIDTWSSRAVEIIWETGGIFDKMVGDCVIGLWGPPFYELDAESACRRAAEAARRIRDYTGGLAAQAGLEVLRALERPMGVATSLHYTRMCVGYFGPNENFTGFSAGMNATARLQGVAERDEILCMEDFVAAYGDPSAFGEERSAKVKNVAHAIRFRPLVG